MRPSVAASFISFGAPTLGLAFAWAIGCAALPTSVRAENTTPVVQTSVERPTPEPSPTPTGDAPAGDAPAGDADLAPVDRTNIARAKSWFARVQAGTVDRAQLTPAFAAALAPELVRQASTLLQPFGPPKTFGPAGKFVRDGITTYDFYVGWADGGVVYQFALDDATGKIAGYFTRPAASRLTR